MKALYLSWFINYDQVKPDIGKRVFSCSPHLNGLQLINYHAIYTPCEGVNGLAAGERLGRKINVLAFYISWSGFKVFEK